MSKNIMKDIDFHDFPDFTALAGNFDMSPEKLCASTAKFSASCAGKNIAGNNV